MVLLSRPPRHRSRSLAPHRSSRGPLICFDRLRSSTASLWPLRNGGSVPKMVGHNPHLFRLVIWLITQNGWSWTYFLRLYKMVGYPKWLVMDLFSKALQNGWLPKMVGHGPLFWVMTPGGCLPKNPNWCSSPKAQGKHQQKVALPKLAGARDAGNGTTPIFTIHVMVSFRESPKSVRSISHSLPIPPIASTQNTASPRRA